MAIDGNRDRDLWMAVLVQAADDLANESFSSIEYGEAVAFFLSPSTDCRTMREFIADAVGLHSNDIERLARNVIARREVRDPRPRPEPVATRVTRLPEGVLAEQRAMLAEALGEPPAADLAHPRPPVRRKAYAAASRPWRVINPFMPGR